MQIFDYAGTSAYLQADEAQTMQTKVAKPRARLTQDEVLEIYSQKGRGLSASKICLRFI